MPTHDPRDDLPPLGQGQCVYAYNPFWCVSGALVSCACHAGCGRRRGAGTGRGEERVPRHATPHHVAGAEMPGVSWGTVSTW
jgi:hypothetical protein